MRLTALVAAGALACAILAGAAGAALGGGFAFVAAGPSGGAVYRGIFPSQTAPGPLRPGFVYVPPGYDTHPQRRYPVVYLLHGMPGDPSEYVDALDVAGTGDRLVSTGAARPFVAVMPAAGTSAGYNGEWAGPWETYLVHDVVPWVDRHLRTRPTRTARTLAGLSAGGYGAADVGLRWPQLFGRIEAWSAYFHPLRDGPFAHADRGVLLANDPFRLALRRARQLQRLGTRFFVSSGPSHSHWFTERQTVDFAAELRRVRLPTTTMLLQSKKGMYARQLESGLRWALGHRAAA